MAQGFSFQTLARDPSSRARTGVLATAHGNVETPAFLPVATQATVKGLTGDDLKGIGVQVLIANTYHLALRPGADLIAELGGLHQFMQWDSALSTDSGGFQVFSLGAAIRDGVGKIADIFPDDTPRSRTAARSALAAAPLCKIDDQGVTFRSHLDGATLRLTPASSMLLQHQLGADMMMAFDECTSPLDDHAYTQSALTRTHRWALECLEQHAKTARPYQALFGIVQGGMFQDLRAESADTIGALPFDGLAIGGSLGRSKSDMHAILDWTIPRLPDGKPRHLLGIGELDDLVECVARGIDLFDCAAPTRWARNGALIISAEGEVPAERITIGNARFANDSEPLDPGCDCFTCAHYSRAYLHHLHRAKELVYYRLASLHNLRFMMRFMQALRNSIAEKRFTPFHARYRQVRF